MTKRVEGDAPREGGREGATDLVEVARDERVLVEDLLLEFRDQQSGRRGHRWIEKGERVNASVGNPSRN